MVCGEWQRGGRWFSPSGQNVGLVPPELIKPRLLLWCFDRGWRAKDHFSAYVRLTYLPFSSLSLNTDLQKRKHWDFSKLSPSPRMWSVQGSKETKYKEDRVCVAVFIKNTKWMKSTLPPGLLFTPQPVLFESRNTAPCFQSWMHRHMNGNWNSQIAAGKTVHSPKTWPYVTKSTRAGELGLGKLQAVSFPGKNLLF